MREMGSGVGYCASEKGGAKGVREEVNEEEAKGSRRKELLTWQERSCPYT
jgi:hypothetical protein